MKVRRKLWLGLLAGVAAMTVVSSQASAQQQQKPNIVFIIGDDIGWMQPRIYHRGLIVRIVCCWTLAITQYPTRQRGSCTGPLSGPFTLA